MNKGILLYEDNFDEVMKYFNIDEQYFLLKEIIFYDDVILVDLYDNKFIENYYKKFIIGKILFYYIIYLRVFFKMMKIFFDNVYFIRFNFIGNYEKSVNKKFGVKFYFFVLYSILK